MKPGGQNVYRGVIPVRGKGKDVRLDGGECQRRTSAPAGLVVKRVMEAIGRMEAGEWRDPISVSERERSMPWTEVELSL